MSELMKRSPSDTYWSVTTVYAGTSPNVTIVYGPVETLGSCRMLEAQRKRRG
jgi:hypothetical protein